MHCCCEESNSSWTLKLPAQTHMTAQHHQQCCWLFWRSACTSWWIFSSFPLVGIHVAYVPGHCLSGTFFHLKTRTTCCVFTVILLKHSQCLSFCQEVWMQNYLFITKITDNIHMITQTQISQPVKKTVISFGTLSNDGHYELLLHTTVCYYYLLVHYRTSLGVFWYHSYILRGHTSQWQISITIKYYKIQDR